jgi:branched-chain amino acid transport system permease protein
MNLVNLLIGGLTTGAVYGLFALGLVLIYRGTGIVNFGQGQLYMLGAFAGWAAAANGLPWGVAVAVAVVFGGLASGILYLLLRLLHVTNPLHATMATLGFGIVLTGMVRLAFGTQPRIIESPTGFSLLKIGPVATEWTNLLVIGISLLAWVVIWLMLERTRLGLEMKALYQDREASELVGINVPALASGVWMLGGAAAGLAGFVLSPLTTVTPDIGIIIVHGFAGAILGGFERIDGAMIGGITLGILQVLIASYLSTSFASVLSLLVVIVVLVVRPSGLLGRA